MLSPGFTFKSTRPHATRVLSTCAPAPPCRNCQCEQWLNARTRACERSHIELLKVPLRGLRLAPERRHERIARHVLRQQRRYGGGMACDAHTTQRCKRCAHRARHCAAQRVVRQSATLAEHREARSTCAVALCGTAPLTSTRQHASATDQDYGALRLGVAMPCARRQRSARNVILISDR